MTMALGGAETVLVISGPNTGGKTVALKTVGMAVLSAQSGIPVAAQDGAAAASSIAFWPILAMSNRLPPIFPRFRPTC